MVVVVLVVQEGVALELLQVVELRVKQTLAEAVGVVGTTVLPAQRRVALAL